MQTRTTAHVVLAFALSCAPLVAAMAQQAVAPATAEEQEMLALGREGWKANGLGEMTPEQELAILTKYRALRTDMAAGILALRQASTAPGVKHALPSLASAQTATAQSAPSPAAMTKADLASELGELAAQGPFVVFARRRDGFTINGTPHLDPDGPITDFGGDGVTGTVSYVVDLGDGSAAVKHYNVHAGKPPLRIGSLTRRGEQVSFQSVTGESAGGIAAKPTSRGLVLLRDGSLVSYDLANGTKVLAVPEGFHVAEFQNGDIGATRHVLVERDERQSTDAGKLMTDGAALFSVFGKEKSHDYGLLNVDNGNVIALNMALSGKQVGHGTGCSRQTGLVNRCSGWKAYNAIYQPDGRPNYSHYFWALQWQNTAHGPVATAIENGLKEVNVIRLGDGARFNAFRRGMGIQYFDTESLPNGSLKLVAYWAFRGHPVEDISTLLTPSAGSSGGED